jgi:hypothetical protein
VIEGWSRRPADLPPTAGEPVPLKRSNPWNYPSTPTRCASWRPAPQKRWFDTFEEVTDGHGSTIYETDLVFSTDQTSRIFPIRTMTRPEGVTLGQAVQPVDLVISTWEIGEGFVLYAEALELVFESGREASR